MIFSFSKALACTASGLTPRSPAVPAVPPSGKRAPLEAWVDSPAVQLSLSHTPNSISTHIFAYFLHFAFYAFFAFFCTHQESFVLVPRQSHHHPHTSLFTEGKCASSGACNQATPWIAFVAASRIADDDLIYDLLESGVSNLREVDLFASTSLIFFHSICSIVCTFCKALIFFTSAFTLGLFIFFFAFSTTQTLQFFTSSNPILHHHKQTFPRVHVFWIIAIIIKP